MKAASKVFRKKAIQLFLALSLTSSCSDNLEIDLFNETYFSPPEWIIGTWVVSEDDNEEYSFVQSLEFTRDNFIVNPNGEAHERIDFNQYINEMRNIFTSQEADIRVQSTENQYRLSISPPIVTDNYTFKKIDDQTISCIRNQGNTLILKKVP